jgi:hypothetical protein
MKAHKPPAIYTLIDDDIDRIAYQVRDSTKDVVQHVLQLHEDMRRKVQEKLKTLQQLLELMSIALERIFAEGQPTSVAIEVRAVGNIVIDVNNRIHCYVMMSFYDYYGIDVKKINMVLSLYVFEILKDQEK